MACIAVKYCLKEERKRSRLGEIAGESCFARARGSDRNLIDTGTVCSAKKEVVSAIEDFRDN